MERAEWPARSREIVEAGVDPLARLKEVFVGRQYLDLLVGGIINEGV